MNPNLAVARKAVEAKQRQLRNLTADALNDDLLASERRVLDKRIQTAEAELTVLEKKCDQQEGLAAAREVIPPDGTASNSAIARGSLRYDSTYRPDVRNVSFYMDVVNAANSPNALERLSRNQAEALDQLEPEARAITSAGGGAGFIPPIYLGNLWAALPRASRPFAAAIGSQPLVESGMTLSVPRITTGTAVVSQTTQNTSIGTQDIASSQLSVPVVTIAGYLDMSCRQQNDPCPGSTWLCSATCGPHTTANSTGS